MALAQNRKESRKNTSSSTRLSHTARNLTDGPHVLTDAELLTVLIRTGIPHREASAIAQDLLKRMGGLSDLSQVQVADLMEVKGLKAERAAQVSAALEIARRISLGRHLVHSENPVSVHISNLKALTHDAILFLAPKGREPSQRWALPQVISKEDSYRFVKDCATTLGWMLNADLSENETNLKCQNTMCGVETFGSP